jgi:hypothetical protein
MECLGQEVWVDNQTMVPGHRHGDRDAREQSETIMMHRLGQTVYGAMVAPHASAECYRQCLMSQTDAEQRNLS